VLVLVHTGSELDPRPGAGESEAMDRLRAWGADLVVGSGAHVIQEAHCAGESARFSGLGNFLFDMVASETRRGLVLTCEESEGEISCSTQVVQSERGDPRPRLVGERGPECRFRPAPAVVDDWRAYASAANFDFVQPFPEAGEGGWFGTWTRAEEFDSLIVPRPRVFSVRDEAPGQVGRDVWRGSSLARPLVSARVLRYGSVARLCALERGDTVFAPDPQTRQRIWRVWAWTGFGFRVDPGFGCEGWSLRPVENSHSVGSGGGSMEDR
jgi:hypothetical protein